MYKDNNTNNITLTNGINPFKTYTKYIRYKYNLHICVGMKFQSHGCR